MELVELKDKEFNDFAETHKYGTFMQNSYWGEHKSNSGWGYKLLGVKENNKIVAGCLLLSKKMPLGKFMYYAPRGYLLDYENLDMLEKFDALITDYSKKHNGMLLKIDPYVQRVERDADNNIIEGSFNNDHIIKKLKDLGFKAQDEKIGSQGTQIKWMYWINIKDKTIDDVMNDMTNTTKRMIRKNEKNGVVVRDGSYEDLEEFKKVTDQTGESRGFATRPLDYLQSMYKELDKNKHIKLVFADLLIEDKLNEHKEEYKKAKEEYDKLVESASKGTKVSEKTLKEKEAELERLDGNVKEFQELYDTYGSKTTLGAVIYIIYNNEVMSFIGGNYDHLLKFQPFYTIHYEMIKYAIDNKFEYYNFYGISSNLSPDDPMYGVYQFKRGFGGQVVELIGEYDKKISPVYTLYKGAYGVYHGLNKFKAGLHKKKTRK